MSILDKRIQLQTLLESILGSRNVYFQPPESVALKYPAIVYTLSNINNSHANDNVYMTDKNYLITVIDSDPDSEIRDKVSRIPTVKFDRHFTSNNLNHDVFVMRH